MRRFVLVAIAIATLTVNARDRLYAAQGHGRRRRRGDDRTRGPAAEGRDARGLAVRRALLHRAPRRARVGGRTSTQQTLGGRHRVARSRAPACARSRRLRRRRAARRAHRTRRSHRHERRLTARASARRLRSAPDDGDALARARRRGGTHVTHIHRFALESRAASRRTSRLRSRVRLAAISTRGWMSCGPSIPSTGGCSRRCAISRACSSEAAGRASTHARSRRGGRAPL